MTRAGDDGVEAQRRRAAARLGAPPERVRVAVSPYRICPLGAHVDHQGGPVLGMAISARSALAFVPSDDDRCALESRNYPGRVAFAVRAPKSDAGGGEPGWGRYARGAAGVLGGILPAAARGVRGLVGGSLPGGGLSSSASVTLAYLVALAEVNGLALGPRDLALLARRAENEWVGVACGVLDPASIAGARRGHLLDIDTRATTWQAVPLGAGGGGPRILIAFTGVPRELARTDFNRRVEECFAAARALARSAGRPDATRLGDLDDAEIEAHLGALDAVSARRVRHFRGECARVRQGVACWRRGDLAAFGALMNASCESSRVYFETGSPELIRLQQILEATPGVYGSRFSGAGFGGCAVALVAAGAAGEAAARVERDFGAAHPALRAEARCLLVDSDDAVRVV